MREFNFRQLPGSDRKYYVDVPDGKGNRIIFYMYKDESGWKTSGNLPAWIQSAEAFLSDAIEQQEGTQEPNLRRRSG